MENGQQILPNEQILPEEPTNSEVQLTKEEINEKIKHFWKQVDLSNNFTEYKDNFDQLNHYRDLKQKLYK